MARILGVDPGLTRCGWAIIESGKLLDSGLLQSSPADPPHTRVGAISAELEQIVVSHKPSLIALERVFAQANLRSVMGVAQVSGALMATAHRLEIGVEFFTPSEVKAAVTGNGRATKDQVKLMVSKLLGLSEVPDVADAMAVALTASKRSSLAQTAAQRKWVAAAKAAKPRLG
jgi:crossover junction endodeoxyribonuclease RuvC